MWIAPLFLGCALAWPDPVAAVDGKLEYRGHKQDGLIEGQDFTTTDDRIEAVFEQRIRTYGRSFLRLRLYSLREEFSDRFQGVTNDWARTTRRLDAEYQHVQQEFMFLAQGSGFLREEDLLAAPTATLERLEYGAQTAYEQEDRLQFRASVRHTDSHRESRDVRTDEFGETNILSGLRTRWDRHSELSLRYRRLQRDFESRGTRSTYTTYGMGYRGDWSFQDRRGEFSLDGQGRYFEQSDAYGLGLSLIHI